MRVGRFRKHCFNTSLPSPWRDGIDPFFTHVHSLNYYAWLLFRLCQILSKIEGMNWDPNLSLKTRRAFSVSLWFPWEYIESRCDLEKVINFWEPQFAYQWSGDDNITSLTGSHRAWSLKSIQWNASCDLSIYNVWSSVSGTKMPNLYLSSVSSSLSQPDSLPFIYSPNLSHLFFLKLIFILERSFSLW